MFSLFIVFWLQLYRLEWGEVIFWFLFQEICCEINLLILADVQHIYFAKHNWFYDC